MTEDYAMSNPSELETITLGAGCFWCLDAVARRTDGIVSSVVGYAGARASGPPPNYDSLHYSGSGSEAYVEAVQITFDRKIISLEDILSLFFQSHDPTTANRDGANVGPEYHSTIFYHTDEQRDAALSAIEAWTKKLGKPVITTVKPFDHFYVGETEHQDFYNSYAWHPYCRVVILPKLRKLNKD
jgi:peptide-methionine (S)-S-oxide reductase